MAKVIEPGFSGRLGSMIFYKLKGKNIVRSLPRRYKQTKATKVSASEFGRASGIGSSIRSQLAPIILNPTDNKMQTSLVSAVFEWLRSKRSDPKNMDGIAYSLRGFNFSEKSTFTVRGRGFPAITISRPSAGQVQIHIPAFVPKVIIKAPLYTVSIFCKLCTGITDLKNNQSPGSSYEEIEIPYNDTEVPARTINIKISPVEKVLIVTGASLNYRLNKNGRIQENTNKAFMPVEILSAVCL
jgi:hypothetical protein